MTVPAADWDREFLDKLARNWCEFLDSGNEASEGELMLDYIQGLNTKDLLTFCDGLVKRGHSVDSLRQIFDEGQS